MKKPDREIFRKVAVSEKKSILKTVASKELEIILKGSGDQIYYLKGQQVLEGGLIEVQNPNKRQGVPKNEDAIVNMIFQNQRYFFQTTVVTSGQRIILNTAEDFYLLQRRKSPRLDIPDGYQATLNVVEYNGKKCFHDCRILDFGSGGVKVTYQRRTPYFKSADSFSAFLHIGSKTPIKIECEIRHTSSNGPNPTIPQIFGIRFIAMNSIDENRLLVVFMDLQRELFVRLAKKP